MCHELFRNRIVCTTLESLRHPIHVLVSDPVQTAEKVHPSYLTLDVYCELYAASWICKNSFRCPLLWGMRNAFISSSSLFWGLSSEASTEHYMHWGITASDMYEFLLNLNFASLVCCNCCEGTLQMYFVVVVSIVFWAKEKTYREWIICML